MKRLRTLWVLVLALVAGFAVQAQRLSGSMTITNLTVTTINGYNADSVLTNSAASKLEATNGVAVGIVATNGTVKGTLTYDLSDESRLTANLDYGIALDVGLYSTTAKARIRSVGTIADIVAIDPLTSDIFSYVKVLGYSTAGDGGGGDFRRVLASSGSTNLGTFFASTANATYAWQRVPPPFITPEMFGAVVNDATSDLTAINNALTYLHGLGGGVLQFGSGQYDINGSIVLKYRTSLRGQLDNRLSDLATSAAGSTNRLVTSSTAIALMAAANAPMVVGDPTDGYVRQSGETWEDGSGPFDSKFQSSSIKGITFIGNGFNQTRYDCDILRFTAKWNLTVEDCSFFNPQGYAARFMDLNYLRWHRNQIVGSYGYPASKGMFFWGSSDSQVTDSYFGATTGPTLWVAGGTSAKNEFANLLTYNAVRTNSSLLISNLASGVFTTATAHYLETGDPVRWVTDGTLPSGLTASGISWVVKLSTNTFGVNPVWKGATNGVYTNYSAGSGNLWVSVGPASGIYESDSAGANKYVNIRGDQHSDEGIYLHGSRQTTMIGVYAGDNGGSYNGETNLSKFAVMLDGAIQNQIDGLSVQESHGALVFTNAAAANDVLLYAFESNVPQLIVDNTVGQNNAWKWADVNLGRQVFAGTTLLSNSAPVLNFTAGNGASGARINVTGGSGANLIRFQNAGTTTHTFGTDGSIASTSATIPTVTASTTLNSGGTATFTGAVVLTNSPVITFNSTNGTSGLRFNATDGSLNMIRFQSNSVTTRTFYSTGNERMDGDGPQLDVVASNGNSGYRVNVLGGATALVRFQTNGTTTHSFLGNGDIYLTGAIELGHATDTTLARSAAGVVTIEGVTVAERPTTTALTYSGTNVTLTATSHVLHGNTLTLTNNCLLTITSSDGASGGITIVPHSSTSYTVYLNSAIKLLGGGSSFVVTNSASETVNLEWKQTLRGGSSVILANRAVYP